MRLIILLILYFPYNILSSQNIELMLIAFEQNNLWGYMDNKKNVIINPMFEEAYPTYHLMGRFKKNGKYGFINNHGKIIIKPKYKIAEDFQKGIALVNNGSKSYYINTDGRKFKGFITSCGHHLDYPYPTFIKDSTQLNLVPQYTQRIAAKILLPSVDSLFTIAQSLIVKKSNSYLLYHFYTLRNPEDIIKSTEFSYDSIKYFECNNKDGQMQEQIGIKSQNLWGYLFLDIPIRIISPNYINISGFDDNFFLVEFEPGRNGYIDYYGNEYFIRQKK